MADGVLNPISSPQYGQPSSTQNLSSINPRGNLYNDPEGLRGSPVQSSIGLQDSKHAFYLKPIILDVQKKAKFSRLASITAMPKNMGTKIKQTVYYPLLDDRNLNDQGIDARGVQIRNGNLYGSSRDIGRILGALPTLTEVGGRVNRVGFSRSEVEGTMNNFGLFFEYSRDLLNFDSDKDLYSFMYQQALEAAQDVTEDLLQIDLITGAGTVVYAGNAISDATMNENSVITLQSLRRLERALDDNGTPKRTRLIKGSGNYATVTAQTTRTIFCSAAVVDLLRNLSDRWGNRAFKEVHEYAAGTNQIMEDEVGIIDHFRVVQCDKMVLWEGAGAQADPEFGLSHTNGKYDIHPVLCVGEDAFTTISFEGSNGINNKFMIKAQKPAESYSAIDPFGKMGFVSIEWWYGILFQRPERIGLIKTVAPM